MDITHLRAKTCTVCGEIKPVSEFGKHKGGKFGLNPRCKSCDNKKNALYYKNNVNKVKERNAKHYSENKDKVVARHTRYRLNNLEKYAEITRNRRMKKPEEVAKSNSMWRSRNSNRLAVNNARRRATKLQATVTWADPIAILALYTEARRLTKETGIKHHVDHIVPLQSPLVCGLHVEYNLQILTYKDNISKKNKFTPGLLSTLMLPPLVQ